MLLTNITIIFNWLKSSNSHSVSAIVRINLHRTKITRAFHITGQIVEHSDLSKQYCGEKIGIGCFSRFALMIHGPWPKTSKASLSRINQAANKLRIERRLKKSLKTFQILLTIIKYKQDKKVLEISRASFKKPIHQMFGHPGWNADLKAPLFPGATA